jgi:hypothetical protein
VGAVRSEARAAGAAARIEAGDWTASQGLMVLLWRVAWEEPGGIRGVGSRYEAKKE